MKLRQLLLIPMLLIGLAAGGCAAEREAFGRAVSAITATIVNPVGPVNIYQVKLTYAAAQELVLEYKDKCFGADGRKTVAQIQADRVLSALCAHRISRWQAMQAADRNAYAAIETAENFIANNPTGNAVSYLRAAWDAVNDFKTRAGS